MLILFLKGAFLGLALAAPVGPINLLCMKRSLEQGQRAGLITGLGAATGDTIYGSIAAFGLTFISDWLELHKAPLSLVGGVFFFILGVMLIRAKVSTATKESGGGNLYFSTVFLTLSNPAVVFSFLTAFATIKLNTHDGDHVQPIYALFATVGVFCGSMVWWIFLSWISAKFRASLNETALRRINRGAGVLLLIFGSLIFWRGVQGLQAPASSSTVSSIH